MSDPAPPDHPAPEPPPPPRPARIVVLLVFLAVVAAAVYLLFFTDAGRQLRDDPHAAGERFRAWVAGHGAVAPILFVLLYVAAGLSLPVWWLQILAGYGFGLWAGVAYSLTGAVVGSAAGFLVARTLLADYVHRKFEARHARLREIDEKMGHNGFMVVMAVRLMHFLPFSVSNYLFGLSRITLIDVALGTLLGNAPLITFYVAVGAGLNPLGNWKFMVILTAINVLLLVPVALRYWKPEWFKRIGVE